MKYFWRRLATRFYAWAFNIRPERKNKKQEKQKKEKQTKWVELA
jgi:hypothetical protein